MRGNSHVAIQTRRLALFAFSIMEISLISGRSLTADLAGWNVVFYIAVTLERSDIVLPFVPFVGLAVNDCLNPLPAERAYDEDVSNHDFKEFRSGQIEKIEWGSFHDRFVCLIASIETSENGLGTDVFALEKLGWHLEGYDSKNNTDREEPTTEFGRIIAGDNFIAKKALDRLKSKKHS
ncbi:MAG: hypothetical protein PHY92_03590 [Alphaproteobacteria bacterium]|nr:hypothetical protein [Alphaproteobacteria bacterium]